MGGRKGGRGGKGEIIQGGGGKKNRYRKERKSFSVWSRVFLKGFGAKNQTFSLLFFQPMIRRGNDPPPGHPGAPPPGMGGPPPPGAPGGPPGGGGPPMNQQQQLNMLSKLHQCEIHVNKSKRRNRNFLQAW